MLWSIPTSLLIGITSAVKPHTSPGASRREGHLEGHLQILFASSENLGAHNLASFSFAFLPFAFFDPEPLLFLRGQNHLPSRKQEERESTLEQNGRKRKSFDTRFRQIQKPEISDI